MSKKNEKALNIKHIDLMIEDATIRLSEVEGLANIKMRHIEDRYFSVIYDVTGTKENKIRRYVLKISTTSRSCEKEYNTYNYLIQRDINTIFPIAYSNKYNYIITKKEDLTDFQTILLSTTNREETILYFTKIGQILKKLEIQPKMKFDQEEYINYLMPRIKKSKAFSKNEKGVVINKIEKQLGRIENQLVTKSLVSDFSFGNIHFKNNIEPVLLDMGDAAVNDSYYNITVIYLEIKFGVLSKYYERQTRTRDLFRAFLEGYGIQSINRTEFFLYQLRHLMNMVNFTVSQKKKSRNLVERLQLTYYLYRYKRYIFNTVGRE